MKRRAFIAGASAGVLTAACDQDAGRQSAQVATPTGQTFQWKIVTTWPRNFPVLGTAVETLVSWIDRLSAGRLKVKVYAAGEIVPAFGVFDAVSEGVAEMGHSGAYYWKGKNEAFQFFTSIPFGMNAPAMNAWLYEGDGMDLWREAYAPFGLVPLPAGNTGMQMGGWFNREINAADDFGGLKMRLPGLGGDVLRRLGATPVTLPGAELLTAMQTGVIDATEWVNPYADLAFGLHKVSKYYYYPGWHEPGPTLECIINRKAYDSLPEDLRDIVHAAARIANQQMFCESNAKNYRALDTLRTEHKVDLRPFSGDIIKRLRKESEAVKEELAGKNKLARRVYNSYKRFQDELLEWHRLSEGMYYAMW